MLTIYTLDIGRGVTLVADQLDDEYWLWWLTIEGRQISRPRRARSLAGAIWGGRQYRNRWLAMI